jgi:diguanylate cyclase (GGDEF)-like protein
VYDRVNNLVRWGAFTAATLVLLLGGLALYASHQFLDAASWVNHTTAVIGEIRAARVMLGPETPYEKGRTVPLSASAILNQINRIAKLTADSPLQRKVVEDLRALFSRGNAPDALAADPATLQKAHALLGLMQSEEYRLLSVRTGCQAAASRRASLAASALCGALLVVGLIMALAARRQFRMRETAESTLQAEKDDLTRYSRELALVSAGSELIQAAQDETQLNAAVAQILREMLPEASGYFALVSPSKDSVEVCESWGCGQIPEAFHPTDCVALQLGRKVHRAESLVHIPCKHVNPCSDCICMPLRSPTGFLGVLHVESASIIPTKRADSIGLFAAQVTLGLTNLRMREALRSQSVRDPLTGLFNRRYFDETLQRELAGYRREGTPLSILMLDLDHFKKVNDSHGHAAGDDALRALGRLMRSSFRESDVICRYGGEEFAVVLLNSDLDGAYAKAENFRHLVEQTGFSWNGRDIGRLTASVGVACCTEFDLPDQLVQASDAALYQAKRMGRNSTFVCSGQPGVLPAVKPPSAREAHLAKHNGHFPDQRAGHGARVPFPRPADQRAAFKTGLVPLNQP